MQRNMEKCAARKWFQAEGGSTAVSLIVFFLAFAVRSFILLCVFRNSAGSELHPDSTEYIRLARGIVEHGVFPVIKRGPVYPAFLAFMFFIFKTHFIQAVVCFQVVLDSLTAVLVYRIAGYLTPGRRTAAAAGAIYALCPVCITSTGLVMTETLFSFFFTAAFVCFIRCLGGGGARNAAASGLLLGIAVLTRSILTPLLCLMILFLLFTRRDRATARNAVLMAAGIAVVVFPWVVRNYFYYGSPVVTNIVNYNLYCCESPAAEYTSEKGFSTKLLGTGSFQEISNFTQKKWVRNQDEFNCLWTELTKNPKENDRRLLERMGAESKAVIHRHLGGVLALHLIGIWQTLRPSSGENILIRLWGRSDFVTGAVTTVFRVFDSIAFIFFAIGSAMVAIRLFLRKMPAVWALIAIIVFYISFMPGGVAYSRFREPAQFLISILASVGITHAVTFISKRKGLARAQGQKIR
jgi:hypothetical protein